MAMHGHSEACCKVPPAKADYDPKGSYIDLKNGMKCYKTGPSDASAAIFVIMDIFGFKEQTLQGCDILAHADDEHHQYQVFMPDFFFGKPFPVSGFPPDTPEKQKALGEFFSGPAEPTKTAGLVPELVKELTEHSSGTIKKWAALGYCWGGKVISLSSKAGTPFVAAAECHPAMVDANDAKDITVPMALLPSGDEDKEDVKKFKEALKTESLVETFADQLHGWMAARADLSNPRIKAEYERGYQVLTDFYHKHL